MQYVILIFTFAQALWLGYLAGKRKVTLLTPKRGKGGRFLSPNPRK